MKSNIMVKKIRIEAIYRQSYISDAMFINLAVALSAIPPSLDQSAYSTEWMYMNKQGRNRAIKSR